MVNDRVIPGFATEAEEAKWWFEHDDELTGDFVQAAREGTLAVGSAAHKAGLPAATVLLDPEDLFRAQAQAEKRGLPYQAYVQALLHAALLREEQSTQVAEP